MGIFPCGPAEGGMRIFSDLLSEDSLLLMYFCVWIPSCGYSGGGMATDIHFFENIL